MRLGLHSLSKLVVRSNSGDMIPVSNLRVNDPELTGDTRNLWRPTASPNRIHPAHPRRAKKLRVASGGAIC